MKSKVSAGERMVEGKRDGGYLWQLEEQHNYWGKKITEVICLGVNLEW